MIRRRPTLITVTEEDIQHVLDNTFLTSFSKEFEQLNLEDQGQDNNGSSSPDSPSNSDASNGPGEDGNVNPNRGQAGGSFCTGNQSKTSTKHGVVMGAASPMGNSPSLMAQSAHPVDTVGAPAMSRLLVLGSSSSPLPRPANPGPGRQAGTWFILPLDQDSEAGTTTQNSPEKQGENNCRTNPFHDAWAATKDAEHSRLPTLQESHESHKSIADIPDMTSTSFHPGT